MTQSLKLGVVQMTSTNRHDGNIAFARDVVAEAAAKGCQMVAFPEVAGLMNRKLAHERSLVGPAETDPYIRACQDLARDHTVWIHTGSTPVTHPREDKFLNHSNLIDERGQTVAAFDKIHLFDMYPEGAPPILESKRYAPGQEAVLAQSPWGPLGMSICYDLRFPQLYRDYAQAGATLLFIPSAFTVPTGQAHWQVLLQSRAIETGAFVIAAAQTGLHDDGRATYGHSMVVGPWGEVLLNMKDKVGLATVEIDLRNVASARARIPSLAHDRSFSL